MKKVYYILILFGFLLSSCSEREEITNVIKHDLVFIGDIDNNPLTKTTLGGKVSDDVRKVLWNPEDKLAITVGRETVEEFSYIGTEDNAQGEFSGLIEEGANYFAFYPYSEDKSITYKDNAFNITLPQVQNYQAGSFAKDTYPMLAKSNNFNLKFKALCGALELNLVGTESIKSITFSGNNAAGNKYPVSGAATVSTDYTDFPSILMSKTANTSVKLACGEKGVLLNAEKETAFFIVLPPATYHTFTLSIESVSGKTMIVNASKPLSITRAMSTETANLKFEDKVVEATYDYVDEYGVNHGKGVTVAGVVWAPVNCGYLAAGETHKGYVYGKLYQWGRNYGQGYDSGDATYPSGSNIVAGPVSNATGNSLSNKDKFYKSDSNNDYDWCNPQLTEWSSENDPCPKGWRVPTYDELNKLNDNYSSWTTNNGQNGYWFSGDKSYSSAGDAKVFFPAAGYRHYTGGAHKRGSDGLYWSSSVDGIFAHYLGFGDGEDVGMDYFSRAYGFSVRCVEDLTTPVDPTNVPTVLTKEVSEITSAGAKVKANVTADGGASVTARGVCWSKSHNPTISNSKTEDGSGVGEFSSSITGLTTNTTYYVRAYATNSEGTAYGEELSFTTTDVLYNIKTLTATQTKSEYSSTGFEFKGEYYKYKYTWQATMSFEGTNNIARYGFILGFTIWYRENPTRDGEHTFGWNTYSDETSVKNTYQAYILLDDNQEILGEKKEITLIYGGENGGNSVNKLNSVNNKSVTIGIGNILKEQNPKAN